MIYPVLQNGCRRTNNPYFSSRLVFCSWIRTGVSDIVMVWSDGASGPHRGRRRSRGAPALLASSIGGGSRGASPLPLLAVLLRNKHGGFWQLSKVPTWRWFWNWEKLPKETRYCRTILLTAVCLFLWVTSISFETASWNDKKQDREK